MDALKQKITLCLSKLQTVSHFPLAERKENSWIRFLSNELMSKRYFYKVHSERTKILTIIACHSNTMERYLTLTNNISYLSFPQNDIIVINSAGEKFAEIAKQDCTSRCKAYLEVPNDQYMDFGKWNYVCRHYDISPYDHIIFTNDSYFILGSINHFVNKMVERNASLYGLVSSTEIRHHYQSYLFACRRDAVESFNLFYESKKHLVHGYQDLIHHLELYLSDQFTDKDCLFAVESMPTNEGKNIFFHNDFLYRKLLSAHLLPLIKLRRIYM